MEELEFTEKMLERSDELDQAVYQMCLTFLQLSMEMDIQEEFPWDIAILQDIRDYVIQVLRKHKYTVCDPYIEQDQSQKSKFCEIKECRKEKCNLHS